MFLFGLTMLVLGVLLGAGCAGSIVFNARHAQERPWTGGGSDLSAAVMRHFGSVVGFTLCTVAVCLGLLLMAASLIALP